eukprot:TRINITY_DN328_c0_g1_i1.p1 TRINITY_DN328_c0_g1~~TRINITY_DN328_c0_g1_i1.p1  ORF type:complete len:165 (+),score=19.37 TRINITY_DN328_c0_g1_i1:64-558(+)
MSSTFPNATRAEEEHHVPSKGLPEGLIDYATLPNEFLPYHKRPEDEIYIDKLAFAIKTDPLWDRSLKESFIHYGASHDCASAVKLSFLVGFWAHLGMRWRFPIYKAIHPLWKFLFSASALTAISVGTYRRQTRVANERWYKEPAYKGLSSVSRWPKSVKDPDDE